MTVPQKKKRFEGLIHFKDSLRQTIVCLQASLKQGFATESQSPLIAKLNQDQEEVYFLLFSSNRNVGQISELNQLSHHHLLAFIHQIHADDITSAVRWHQYPQAAISIWMDPSDRLASNYMHNLISQVCQKTQSIDFTRCHGWGSHRTQLNLGNGKQANDWLGKWHEDYGTDEDRAAIMSQLLSEGQSFFSEVQKVSISSDGTYTTLTIDGKLSSRDQQGMKHTLENLKRLPAHIIGINLGNKDQVEFCVPIRVTTATPLKAVFVIHKALSEVAQKAG
ncbi:hypothetical protein [Pseudobacteriovorax antillogorgiicola]|uniref:Uncharacterized protein n=1 Tax=Pseudobacteriovorax antillogorgiicola TaxID=1513793 RepID=A0A1Y6BQ73_9BACT|nr:hypothetical protein [Pseudobacteriovorax antillogorgiicola]TCS53773.1 hypothetical protein EDD56_10782 [Pseudobacteriovorax antillogorgiicola]SMF22434.1 hypothetical protein SAMN06296036_107190 [Pseudobacteriovorax antillogorgiicola]